MEPCFSAGQFDRRYALLRREKQIHTGQRERERRFLEAVFWMGRSGAQWRFLPAAYGKWNSVYTRFARWDDLGIRERLFAQVADDPDRQAVLLDATVVRAHACAAGAPHKGGARPRRGGGGRAAGSARRSTSSSTPAAIP